MEEQSVTKTVDTGLPPLNQKEVYFRNILWQENAIIHKLLERKNSQDDHNLLLAFKHYYNKITDPKTREQIQHNIQQTYQNKLQEAKRNEQNISPTVKTKLLLEAHVENTHHMTDYLDKNIGITTHIKIDLEKPDWEKWQGLDNLTQTEEEEGSEWDEP